MSGKTYLMQQGLIFIPTFKCSSSFFPFVSFQFREKVASLSFMALFSDRLHPAAQAPR
jgi:hypothetical protein